MGICYDNIDRTGDTTGQPASQPARPWFSCPLTRDGGLPFCFAPTGNRRETFLPFPFSSHGGDIWRYLEEEIDFWDNERELELCGKSFKIII